MKVEENKEDRSTDEPKQKKTGETVSITVGNTVKIAESVTEKTPVVDLSDSLACVESNDQTSQTIETYATGFDHLSSRHKPEVNKKQAQPKEVVNIFKRKRGRPQGSKNKFVVSGRGTASKLQSSKVAIRRLEKKLPSSVNAEKTINIASGSLGLIRNASTAGAIHRRKYLRGRVYSKNSALPNTHVPAKVKKWKDNILTNRVEDDPDSTISCDPNWAEKEIVITDVTLKSGGTVTFTECRSPNGFFKSKWKH